jgi:hypothetical protein
MGSCLGCRFYDRFVYMYVVVVYLTGCKGLISVQPAQNSFQATTTSGTADNHSQQSRVPVSHNTALIHAPIRVNIIITKSIPLPIDLLPVHESAEPVHRTARLIIPVRVDSRLQIPPIDQQRPAIESGAQTRHDGAMDCIVGARDRKGPAVAAEDVCGRGFGVSAVVACASEGVVGDAAGDVAGFGLRVDREGVCLIVVPDSVDVLGEVRLESSRVQRDIINRRDDAQRFPLARGLAEVAPGHSVAGGLGDEGGADCRDGGGMQASGGLDGAVAGLHGHAEDEADEVDV